MNTKTVRLERSEDLILRLPEGWAEEGEKVSIKEKDGSVIIEKLVDVEIDLDDSTFLSIAKMAHEKDITFNEMITQIIEEKLSQENLNKNDW